MGWKPATKCWAIVGVVALCILAGKYTKSYLIEEKPFHLDRNIQLNIHLPKALEGLTNAQIEFDGLEDDSWNAGVGQEPAKTLLMPEPVETYEAKETMDIQPTITEPAEQPPIPIQTPEPGTEEPVLTESPFPTVQPTETEEVIPTDIITPLPEPGTEEPALTESPFPTMQPTETEAIIPTGTMTPLPEPSATPTESIEPDGMENEEDELRDVPLTMEQYGTAAVVYSHQDLKQALEDKDITHVYLGADIQIAAGGITVNPSKPQLVISGINPYGADLTRWTLTEFNSSDNTQAITIRTNDGPKKVELRDMEIIASNHYGTVTIYDAARDVEITYNGITYYGPQLTYNRYGTSRYLDCEIYIGAYDRSSPPGEVGEVKNVELGGEVLIQQVEPQANEIFFFELGTASSIKILPGANVTVYPYSASGFVYTTAPTTFEMGENAAFTYVAPQRFWESQPLRKFTLGRNASCYIEIQNLVDVSLLRVNGNVTLNEGSELHLINRGNNNNAILVIGNDGSLVCKDPKSVLLYSPRYWPLHFLTNGAVELICEQLNYWTAAGDGHWEDSPKYHWKKKDKSPLTIVGQVAAGGDFTSVTSNYDISEDDSADENITTSTLSLSNGRVIAFGELPLWAEYLNDPKLQGMTVPLAWVDAYYDKEGEGDWALLQEEAQTSGGNFQIDLSFPIPLNSKILVRSRYMYLFSAYEFLAGDENLGFISYPNAFLFGTVPIKGEYSSVSRDNQKVDFIIRDTRPLGSGWKLYAKLLSYLTPLSNENLPPIEEEVLYILGEDGSRQFLRLGEENLVYEHTKNGSHETTTIHWEPDEGLLMQVPPGTGLTGVEYAAKIQWILVDVP